MSDADSDEAAVRRRLEQRDADGVASAEEIFALAGMIAAADPAAAIQYYARCATMSPEWPAPIAAIGDMFRASGRASEALISYGRALELDPADYNTLLKRGNLLNENRRFREAVVDYEAASVLRPAEFLPHLNRGNTLTSMDELDTARAAYDLALAAGGPAGIRLRRELLLPVIARSDHAYGAAYTRYKNALEALAEDPPRIDNPLVDSPGGRFFLAYHGRNERDLQVQLARIYLAGCPELSWMAPHCRTPDRTDGPRRIAFVCRYLFDHSIGRLWVAVLRKLSLRADCEIVCFATAPPPVDALGQEIGNLVSRTETLPADIFAARERIAAFEPDIVFYPEIGMDPLTYFLAFARLAPVQAVSWGHPITSGIPEIDYFLSCRAAESENPADWAVQYSEQLVLFGGPLSSYPRPAIPEPLGTRASFDLPEDATVYFLAQNLFKIHPAMDAPLGRILDGDPTGIVMLLEGHDPTWGAVLRQRFRDSLGAVADRVRFLPRQDHEDYMRLLALSDVVLDSFPFGGGNTTYQSLAMGTPLVTWPGDYLRGRFSMAIYRYMGITELIATDGDDFADIALRLGTDPTYRANVEVRLAEQCDVIFDDPIFLADAERFLMTAEPV